MSSPWTNQAVSLIILTEQATGFSGMFGYSPTVGHGNLIFSVAAAAGVDPYGNSYPQGVSSDVGQLFSNFLTGGELTVNSGPLLVYTSTHAGGQVYAAGASGNWTAPANVTSVTATLIAGGGAGDTYGGGGGGECAVQTFTVIPGNNYAYSVGNAGQNTTFNGITAHAGSGGEPAGTGAGGTGSNAATHYNGGAGYYFSGFNDYGSGGSSAGPTQPGNAGSGETGGAAVPGGGAGGAGGNPGSAGGTPGGGGGGLNDQSGGGGQLTLSYTGSGSSTNDVLLLAVSAVAGTDSFGNTYGAGLTLASTGVPAAPAAGCILYYSGGSLYAVGPSNTPVLLATT